MGVSDKANHNDKENEKYPDNPPPYSETKPPPPPPLVPEIPPLRLDAGAGPSKSKSVTPDQCVAHLKFLSALADLRDSVGSNDGLFGIQDSLADKFPENLNEARARVREKRWALYTARAVKRFTVWWETCVPCSGERPTLETLVSKEYSEVTGSDAKIMLWSRDALPPLGEWFSCHGDPKK